MKATATFAALNIAALQHAIAAESEEHGSDLALHIGDYGASVVGEAQSVMFLIGRVAAAGSDDLTSYELGADDCTSGTAK